MPGEALLIGIATIAVVVAGFAAIAPALASDRAGWTVGQRYRLRGIVSTSFNVTFESLLPAVIFPLSTTRERRSSSRARSSSRMRSS
jgi:hypothetical protein